MEAFQVRSFGRLPDNQDTILVLYSDTGEPVSNLVDLKDRPLDNPFRVNEAGGKSNWGFIPPDHTRAYDIVWVEEGITLQDRAVFCNELAGTFLGLPSDGSFSDGLLGFASSTRVADAAEDIDRILALLAPPKPVNLSACQFTLLNSITARLAGSGLVSNRVTGDKTPRCTIQTLFYNGDKGTLTAKIDGIAVAEKVLSTANDTGTYGVLSILSDADPYVGQSGKAGFWKGLTTAIEPAVDLTLGQHNVTLEHSLTGLAQIDFTVDQFTAPVVDLTVSGVYNSGAKISGVPCLIAGDVIQLAYQIENAVGLSYHATRLLSITSDVLNDFNGLPSSPPSAGQAVLVTGQNFSVPNGKFSKAASIILTGYAANNLSTAKTLTTAIRVDSASNEAIRKTSGLGEFPETGYGAVFDSTQSLTASEELQLENAYFVYPQATNYALTIPNGPDYSGVITGYRWATFVLNEQFSGTSFTLAITGAINFSVILGVTTNVKIFAKVEGSTGWVDCNKAYPGVGNPVNNGDAAMAPGSSSTTKFVTFGTVVRTGRLYIRIGLAPASNKRFSGIA